MRAEQAAERLAARRETRALPSRPSPLLPSLCVRSPLSELVTAARLTREQSAHLAAAASRPGSRAGADASGAAAARRAPSQSGRGVEEVGHGVLLYGLRLKGAGWTQADGGPNGRAGHLSELGTPAGLPPVGDAELPALWLGALPRASLAAPLSADEAAGCDALLVAHEASTAAGPVAPVPLYASAERSGGMLLELRLPARRAHDGAKWLHYSLAAYAAP